VLLLHSGSGLAVQYRSFLFVHLVFQREIRVITPVSHILQGMTLSMPCLGVPSWAGLGPRALRPHFVLCLYSTVMCTVCTVSVGQELRVHYDQQSLGGGTLEAELKKQLAEVCDSTVLPVCIPVLAVHAATEEGALAPVDVHAQDALCEVWWDVTCKMRGEQPVVE